MQDAGSQAILSRYGNDPGLLTALQEAYGERPADLSLPKVPEFTALDYASDRLAYIKRTGWGTVSNYNTQYNAYNGTTRPYTGLDWSRDGCSAPDGVGLGYRIAVGAGAPAGFGRGDGHLLALTTRSAWRRRP